MNISTGFDLGKSQSVLILHGETYGIKDRLMGLGCKFRRSVEPVTAGAAYWQIEDTECNRALLKSIAPTASGWCWIPPIGLRGIGDKKRHA